MGNETSQVEVKSVRKNRFGSVVALLGVLSAFGAMSAQAQNFLVNKKFVVSPTAVPATQVNNLGPGQTVYLEFNMFNSATGTLSANVTDNLPAGLLGDTTYTPIVTDHAGVIGGNGCVPSGTLSATASVITIANFSLPLNPNSGVLPDCRIVFRVIGNPSAIPVGQTNVTNTVLATQTSATGPGCTAPACQSKQLEASLQVFPIINAGLSKAFSPSTVPQGGNSVMTFTISNNALYPLNNATLTDALPVGAVPQTSPTPTSSCGGSVAVSGQNVTLSGGTIAASGSCTVTVTVKGNATVTNYIPVNALTTTEGVTNATAATAPLTVLDTLSIEKLHDGSSLVTKSAGQMIVTRVRFTNYSPVLTNTTLTDNLPAGLVLAANPNPVSYCGGTATAVAGASTFSMSGMTIPAANQLTGVAGSCDVYFNTVVTAAGTSPITNTINPSDVTNSQGKAPVAATSAGVTRVVTPGPGNAPNGGNWGEMGLQKGFAGDCCSGTNYGLIDQGQTSWLYISAFNPGYDWRYTNGTVTDVLPVGVQVDVPAVPGGAAYTPVSGTDVFYQNWQGSSNAGPNNTGTPTGSWYQGCANTGQVTVTRDLAGQDTITYSGWSTKALSELAAGTGANWYNSGCWFNIRVKGVTPGAYVGGAAPNKPINTIPAGKITTFEGVTNPIAATAPITVLSDVGVQKTFNPHVITSGLPAKITRLTIWLTNKAATAQTSAALTDTLPTLSGWTVQIANPANTATTCGGTVTATPGSGTVAISGGTIPAGTVAAPGKCSFSVDVAVTGPGGDNGPLFNVIPPGALTTSTPNLTNIVEAKGSLYTRPRSVFLQKTFGNGGAALGGTPVPMTITVTGDRWELNNVSVTDNLVSFEPGLSVAPTPNLSTTCRTIDTVAPPFV